LKAVTEQHESEAKARQEGDERVAALEQDQVIQQKAAEEKVTRLEHQVKDLKSTLNSAKEYEHEEKNKRQLLERHVEVLEGKVSNLQKCAQDKELRISQLETSELELQMQAEEKKTSLEACLKIEVDAKLAAEQNVLELQQKLSMADEKKASLEAFLEREVEAVAELEEKIATEHKLAAEVETEQKLALERLNSAHAEEKKDQVDLVADLLRDLEVAKADAAVDKAEAEEAREILANFDEKRTAPLQAELSSAQKELAEMKERADKLQWAKVQADKFKKDQEKSEAALKAAKKEVSEYLDRIKLLELEREGREGEQASQLKEEVKRLDEENQELQNQQHELTINIEYFRMETAMLAAENLRMAEREALMEEENGNLNNLNAHLAGHNNARQKIKHVEALKDENLELKQRLKTVEQQLVRMELEKKNTMDSYLDDSMSVAPSRTAGRDRCATPSKKTPGRSVVKTPSKDSDDDQTIRRQMRALQRAQQRAVDDYQNMVGLVTRAVFKDRTYVRMRPDELIFKLREMCPSLDEEEQKPMSPLSD